MQYTLLKISIWEVVDAYIKSSTVSSVNGFNKEEFKKSIEEILPEKFDENNQKIEKILSERNEEKLLNLKTELLSIMEEKIKTLEATIKTRDTTIRY